MTLHLISVSIRGIANKIAIAILVFAAVLAASENITNFSSPVTVNGFFQWGDTLWAATSGGLRVHNLKNGEAELISNNRVFPDLHLTAVCRDSRGNLWIGSRKGYLYRRTPRGQFTVFSNYQVAGWGILALYNHDGLIIVGSHRGVSLFDPVKGVALRNSAGIAGFSNPRVNAIAVSDNEDTLFLGCDEGAAYLGGLRAAPLSERNFYDAGIWKTKPVGRVASFVQAADSVMALPTPAVGFRGALITASDSGWLRMNGLRVVPRIVNVGNIVSLHNEGDRRLWIGTDESFYYAFDGETQPVQHRMDGFTLKKATRAMVSDNGDAWFLPYAHHLSNFWHQGVYRFDGQNWHRYNESTHHGFGYLGDDAAYGITRGSGGSAWVGTWGGNVKHIDPARNRVTQLVVGNRAFRDVNLIVDGIGNAEWGKVDALATDTLGYIWISVYDSDFGSLICYDPRYPPVSSEEADPVKARYRRFFTEPPLKTLNITLLSVDAANRIFAYDGPQNRLTIFTHGGNPLANGIDTLKMFANVGALSAMEPGDDGAMYIAGAGGLSRIPAGSTDIEIIDNSLSNISGVAARGNVLWLGTRTNGVLRYDLDKGELDNDQKRWIDESSGLSSNNVLSLAVDAKNGFLWIVTDDGVSRLDIGRNVRPSSKTAMRAFPNMFSVSGSNQGVSEITFAGLDPRSAVSIYTINGALVAKVDARRFNDREWRASWTPKRSLVPGTYIAAAKPSGKTAKIILTP